MGKVVRWGLQQPSDVDPRHAASDTRKLHVDGISTVSDRSGLPDLGMRDGNRRKEGMGRPIDGGMMQSE
jgi:hypothetical protein